MKKKLLGKCDAETNEDAVDVKVENKSSKKED